MSGYFLRRIFLAVPLLLGVATIIFSLIHMIPGDPVEVMLGAGAGAGDIEDLRHRLGLDRPLGLQYIGFLKGLIQGDLGISLHYRDPVSGLLAQRLPATLLLALASMIGAAAISLPAGIASALRPGGVIDRLTTIGSVVALSMPSFWLGPLLILLFAIRLDWLPVSGMHEPGALILPALTLSASIAALLTRLLRASLLEESAALYVRAAQARGLSPTLAAVRHALRNALPVVVTVAGLQMGSLLTGAILTETIFSWPGLGRLLVQAIAYRDYPLVQGTVLLFAAIYVVVNLCADLTHALLDPRSAS